MQTQVLRICSGAFWTSPAVALQVEMGEMPLQPLATGQTCKDMVGPTLLEL